MDGCVLFTDAVRQTPRASGPGSGRWQDRGRRWGRRTGRGLGQQSPVLDDGLLDCLGEVLPEVPPVRHVDRVGGAEASGLGVGAGAVAADHLHARVLGQPAGDGRDAAVGQQVDGAAGLDVHQDRRVHVTLAQRELIHAEHTERRRLGPGQPSYQPQQRRTAHRDGKSVSEPGAGTTGQHECHVPQTACGPWLRRPCRKVRARICSTNVACWQAC